MSILYTDNFAYSAGDLHTVAPLWVDNLLSFNVISGGVVTAAGNCLVSYTGVTPPNDQQASVVVGNPTWRIGPAIRCGASGVGTAYFCRPSGGGVGTDFFKVVAGAFTALGTQPPSTPWTAGDVMTIKAQGTTITVYRNGVSIASVTDSAITSGNAGMAGDSPNTTTVAATSFSESSLSAPNPVSISTATGVQGSTNATFTVTGTQFDLSGATLSFSGTGITINSYSVQNATTVTASITISGGAAVGARNVIITNADGQTGTLLAAFTVTSIAPALPVPSANVVRAGQIFATIISSPRTSVMGTNLGTKITN